MSKNFKQYGTIIYVNFSPYENAGKVLDYMLSQFRTVLLFSFNFHHLGANQKPSTLRIYRKGKIVKQYPLFQTVTSAQLAFLLLPIRSLVIFIQMVFHTLRLRKQFGPYDIYFTVNAFTAWTGNVLRSAGIVKKTIFWVWDYYPPIHKSKITMFMRWLYWLFDKPASLHADKTIFLNKRLEDLRKKIGVLPKSARYPIIPIGTTLKSNYKIKRPKNISLTFFGVLKKSQGLDLLFDASKQLMYKFPNLTVHVIGGGPDSDYFLERAKKTQLKIVFHGHIPSDKKVNRILSRSQIGLATYVPEHGNVSYYSDPSKIKKYISYGLPVVTTNVFEFSKEIQTSHAGIIIDYHQQSEYVAAIQEIINHYAYYQRGSKKLAAKYQYKTLYRKMFS